MAEGIFSDLDNIFKKFKDSVRRRAELFRKMQSLEKKAREKRTIMHYVADESRKKENALDVAKKLFDDFKNEKELLKAADKYGRTALHIAAFRGNTELCKFLIKSCEMKAEDVDQNGENLLHFAVRGKTSKEFKNILNLPGVKEIIHSQDAKGKTALHKAAAKKSGLTMIECLLSKSNTDDEGTRTLISQADLFGQTPLHEAACVGNAKAVERLLKHGSSPLECNSDGKTALHYAVQFSRQSHEKAKEVSELLLQHCKSDEERSLLLWASATGIGTAEEVSPDDSTVKKYLEARRQNLEKRGEVSLLEIAINEKRYDMACELVNRGADLDKISKDSKRVQIFLHQIKKMPERGRDQPTIEDDLGREHFAKGLAALFLNPCVKTPLTVGILGDWGMGKSSLMLQTEIILLKTAAQLVFPNLLATENFPGSIKFQLSREGERKYKKIESAVKDLKFEDLTNSNEDPLVYFLDNYQEKYRSVYRALALMDRKVMFQVEKPESNDNRYSIADIPSILTVRYNAWQYQNEMEAWAGLAVEIPKAIEESMTSAQRLRCRCKYAWKEHQNKMILELFLPFFFGVFISGLVLPALFRLFSRSQDKELLELKYGSIAIPILIAVWTIMKKVNSVVKPISAQIMGYLSLPDHRRNLGYQHQVISDIKFLRKQLGKKPSRLWKFIAWLCSLCGCRADNVKHTSIPKLLPPSVDNIRIIVFVDDLDRCKDTVILQVLSAVNLVLAACEINVVLGMDEKMIIRAIQSQYKGNKDDTAEMAEKYLSKIIQLPLALPDANKAEMRGFVEQQLGPDFQRLCNEEDDSNVRRQDSEEINPGGSGCHYTVNIDGNGCHCALNIFPCCKESSPDFSSKVFKFLAAVSSFTNHLFGHKSGLEDIKPKPRLRTPLKMMLLMPNYSPKERDAISRLSEVAVGFGRLPREWKRFLTYHRLAWNILSQSEQVRKCAGWQVQLLVWIFCCWQWKEQINKIIKNWQKLVLLSDDNAKPVEEDQEEGDVVREQQQQKQKTKKKKKEEEEEEKNQREKEEQKQEEKGELVEEQEEEEEEELLAKEDSLRNIVEHYMEDKEARQEMKIKMKAKEGKKIDSKSEMMTQELTKTKVNGEEEVKEQREKWEKLTNTLIKYDVSMECIQAFQKFRLHCEMQYLPPPSSNEKNEKSGKEPNISKDTHQDPSSSAPKKTSKRR